MKDIKGYEGLYAVTSCGKVWSYHSKKFLKPSKNDCGYLVVNLSKDGKPKSKRIHRLVMETYCPVENMNKLQVNHKDECKEHNYLSNLEWCDNEYNRNYGTRNQRAAAATGKRICCIETGVIYESITEAAKSIGRSVAALSLCLSGKTRTCCGYHWAFID